LLDANIALFAVTINIARRNRAIHLGRSPRYWLCPGSMWTSTSEMRESLCWIALLT